MKYMMMGLAAVVLAGPAAAVRIVEREYRLSAPSFNGDGRDGEVVVARWQFGVMPDEVITKALFSSRFGNEVADSSSVGTVSVNGIEVGYCGGPGEACWDGPGAPIRFEFEQSQFARLLGSIVVRYRQTDCCVIRLGSSELMIRTAQAVVPEPATWAMMIAGFGLVGMVVRRRRDGMARLV
ncbi:PEP-CTERM sorting domain-containing protein [Sandaracinobacteroides saxicola]|uniref:PEP-CTERM sorting domain-containing protein n=1 Tax=Sandaracinobacteroides saxicola TaxID=2759707 RepID=A0A7G5IJ30_9SPHN|nr:PEPxxWA-CTERM sorting domain-containing protein [Sandaracinobacteroides saxicola]QMW23372.1 PEP-CTERM sorting domain-containing protein [Sandaracinobacteroides saxicola]